MLWRTRTPARWVSTGAAVAGLTILAGAPSASAVEARDVHAPAQCVVQTPAFRPDTRQVVYGVSLGEASTTVLRPGALGYVPTALVYDRRFGSTSGHGPFYAVSPDGELRYVTTNATARPDGTVAYSYSQVRVRSGWQGVRALADGYDRVFALSGSTLTRYDKSWSPESGLEHRAVIHGSFSAVRTLTYAGNVVTRSGHAKDVLMATLSSGELVQYEIPRSGSSVRATTMATRGFGDYASLSIGPCENDGAQGLLGITTSGTGYAFFDPDASDGSARDFVRTKVATGWRATSYSQ